jgi:CRISPR system Cascade subunit CasE
MTELFLSRAGLRRDAPMAALAGLLVPTDTSARTAASHRLVWSLFADADDRKRDFLWREEGPGRFMALSARPPADAHGLFDVEFKRFAPAVRPGDRLEFTMRVNPVISRSETPGQRGKRHDVVMDALRHVSPTERATARPDLMQSAGRAWLARQGEAHGFAVMGEAIVGGYDRVTMPRTNARPAVFGVLDISGVLEVLDPTCFLASLVQGFGRARAFGCGLMLIRRAR